MYIVLRDDGLFLYWDEENSFRWRRAGAIIKRDHREIELFLECAHMESPELFNERTWAISTLRLDD